MSGLWDNPLARNKVSVIAKSRLIKEWIRDGLKLPEEVALSVSELACALPNCPPKETVILVLSGDVPLKLSIHKAMNDVTKSDLECELQKWVDPAIGSNRPDRS